MTITANAEEESALIGDAYADGKINSKDAIFMLQYLAYIAEIDEESLYISNTYVEDNALDGKIKINSRDVLILLQQLALMDVSLGEGAWRVVSAPSTQESGSARCNTAKGFKELILPALNETDYASTITKQASCNSEGEMSYVYENGKAKFVFTESIPKAPCKIVADKAVAPTCTETGLTEGSHCSVCNKIITEQITIPMTEHSYSSTDWKCTVCQKNEYIEYTSYNDYYHACTVVENGGVVTLTYNQSEAVGLNLDMFGLNGGKTYIFAFGANAGKAKISSNGAQYGNVLISIEGRSSSYDLKLSSIGLVSYYTIISSSAQTLNLGFYGSGCSLGCLQATNGENGYSGSIDPGNGSSNGKNGSNGSATIVCSGALNITCGATTYITGGNGGNGGNGGKITGLGGNGGNGGAGGNGGNGIIAGSITASFVNGATKSNLIIYGGSGGSGGTGAKGVWPGKNGSAGASGSSGLATNVPISYL